jgi:hypothetical protein
MPPARRLQRIENRLQDPVEVRVHFGIPETQNGEPLCRQPRVPHGVMPRPRHRAVLPAVHLDDQPSAEVGEVRHIAPDRRLPAEVRPEHPVDLAQPAPQTPLVRGQRGAKGPGSGTGAGRDAGHG